MPLFCTTAGIARGRGDCAILELLDVEEPDLGAVLENGTLEAVKAAPARGRLAYAEATFLPPVPEPGEMALTGLNYRSHCIATGNAIPSELPFGVIPARAVNAHGADVSIPREAPDHVDYEGEIGLIVSRAGQNVKAGDAWDYIAGICPINDVSARDVQAGGRSAIPRAKGFPGFKPFGPGLLTTDELSFPLDIGLKTWVNGELRQQTRSTDMVFDIPQVVAAVSNRQPLRPGMLILTGTPAGVAHEGKHPFLQADDVVEVEVEGLPRLVNRFVDA